METVLFYIAASVSLVATILVVSRTNASHALIYLIVSLLAVAVIFYLLGAPFAAALEIVIYAGAIMVPPPTAQPPNRLTPPKIG